MSDTVEVRLLLPDGREVGVRLPAGVPLTRLTPALVDKLELPVVGQDGARISYEMCSRGGEAHIGSATLIELGIEDGTYIQLRPRESEPLNFDDLPSMPIPATNPEPVLRRSVERGELSGYVPPLPRVRNETQVVVGIALALVVVAIFFLWQAIFPPGDQFDLGPSNNAQVPVTIIKVTVGPTPRPTGAAISATVEAAGQLSEADAASAPEEVGHLAPIYDLTQHGDGLYFYARSEGSVYSVYRLEVDGGEPVPVVSFENSFPPGAFNVLMTSGENLYFRELDGYGNPRSLNWYIARSNNSSVTCEHGCRLGVISIGEQHYLTRDEPAGPFNLILTKEDDRSESFTSYLEVMPKWWHDAVELDGSLYFAADSDYLGIELHKSDGTQEGTLLVKNLTEGAADTLPHALTLVGNTIYFAAFGDANRLELWRTDGTGNGTEFVDVIQEDVAKTWSATIVATETGLVYFARDETLETSLPTSLRRYDFQTHEISSDDNWIPTEMVVLDGQIYILVHDSYSQYLLLSTASTHLELTPILMVDEPKNLIVVGDQICFQAGALAIERSIWCGAKDEWEQVWRNPWEGDNEPQQLTAVGDLIYFVALDELSRWRLWRLTAGESVVPIFPVLDSE